MQRVENSQELKLFTVGTGTLVPCFSDGEESTKISVGTNMFHQAEVLQMAFTTTANDFVAFGFGRIPEVKRVYTAQHDRAFYVRVVVDDDRDKNLRGRIYAKELEMINEFKIFDFDFDILTAVEFIDPSLHLAYEKKKARHVDPS